MHLLQAQGEECLASLAFRSRLDLLQCGGRGGVEFFVIVVVVMVMVVIMIMIVVLMVRVVGVDLFDLGRHLWAGTRRLVQRVSYRTQTRSIHRNFSLKRHGFDGMVRYSIPTRWTLTFYRVDRAGRGVLDVRDDEEGRELVFAQEDRRLLEQTAEFGDHGTR